VSCHIYTLTNFIYKALMSSYSEVHVNAVVCGLLEWNWTLFYFLYYRWRSNISSWRVGIQL